MRTKQPLHLLILILAFLLIVGVACSGDDTPSDATTDNTDSTSTDTTSTNSATEEAAAETDSTTADTATTASTSTDTESAEVAMPLITAAAAESPTLCQGDEVIYFSCQLQDAATTMSLCGTPDFDGQNGALEFRIPVEEAESAVMYRYPDGDNAPFKYAEESANQSVSFESESTAYELAVTAEDTTYTQFDLNSNDGVIYRCGDAVINQLSQLSGVLPSVQWQGTPIRDQVAAESPAATTAVTTTTTTASSGTYTVKAGDTVFTIAQTLGVDWETIVADNDLQPPYTIYVNQQLLVPGAGAVTTYTVATGDSLTTIGEQFGLSWFDLAQANGIGWPYWVYPGQTLVIPGQ